MSAITIPSMTLGKLSGRAHAAREPSTGQLFGKPPEEIGPVLSAFSSPRLEGEGPRLPQRIIFMAAGSAITFLVVATSVYFTDMFTLNIGLPLALLAAVIVTGIIWLETCTCTVCTYVGKNGATRLKRSAPDGRIQAETLLFSEASFLEKNHRSHMEGEHFIFPAIDEETVTFVWKDAEGKPLFRVKGINFHKDTLSEPMSAYLFARAVEESWTDFRMHSAMETMEKGETMLFSLTDDRGRVELGAKELHFELESGVGTILWKDVDQFYFEDHDLIIALKPGFTVLQGQNLLDIHFRHFPNELLFHRLCETMTGLKGVLHHEHAIASRTLKDPRTGLAGAVLFRDRLEIEISRHKREGHSLAVLLFKFDNLVYINHEFANQTGSLATQVMGRRLTELVRESDTAARLTGSEFAALMPEFGGPEYLADTVDKYANSLKPSMDLETDHVMPAFSIGTALYPQDGETPSDLLRAARKDARWQRYGSCPIA